MHKTFTSNNIKNDDFNVNAEERDYKNLIARLKEISSIIALLEKKIIR
jgi:hypothetical protein